MELQELAAARFQQGYSCSQSVFSAFAERKGIDPEIAFRVSAGFGGGIARCGQTCGCVSGAVMALGLEQRSVSPEDNKSEKDKTYEIARAFMAAFAARHGSTSCRDLLGCDIGTPEGLKQAREQGLFQSRCAVFVRDAVAMAEEIIPRR